MLNKEHFKKWFQTKFNFTQKGTIGVNGKTSTYKSVSDVASLYYKACDEFAMDTDWKLSDCEALIEELKPVKTKVVKNITHAETWVQAVLNAQVSVDGNSVCCMFPASEVEGEIGAQHLIPQH